MSGLTPEQVRHAAWIAGQELARRRRIGAPIPRHLIDCHRALLAEVTATGHHERETATGTAPLETTAERARRLGVSERTIRRRAAARGHPTTGGRYLFRTEHE